MLYVPSDSISHQQRLIHLDEHVDKARSLDFEETFFAAFERWFTIVPLLSRSSVSTSTSTAEVHSRALSHSSSLSPTTPPSPSLSAKIPKPETSTYTASEPPTTARWGTHGQEHDIYTYICHRRADALPSPEEAESKGWWTPETDEEAMSGPVRYQVPPSLEGTSAGGSSNSSADARGSCGMQERGVDRSWGWAEAQLGAIELD